MFWSTACEWVIKKIAHAFGGVEEEKAHEKDAMKTYETEEGNGEESKAVEHQYRGVDLLGGGG